MSTETLTGERADQLAVLGKARHLLRLTTRDLTDEQVARRTTVSELCLGGLIKHVATVEERWADFAVRGAVAMPDYSAMTEADFARWGDQFRMLPGETLGAVLERYAEVARRTDELVATLPDLDVRHDLPKAPWHEPGSSWSVRQVLMTIVAETSQHAGHADIIRESLDGAKTTG
ncbi:DinB family protein [Actinocatenispora rupis]|uniref:DinB family protein n=1 Tax=Actinocatenispora rupis TaxID=519421 RepID=A0A8J3NFW2_9ACTN|nr:DinB family protein [Actinocatenispora rupis]GID15742.1 hypothetical protein Aru02nite_66310 [Actinocatenispora rupis]